MNIVRVVAVGCTKNIYIKKHCIYTDQTTKQLDDHTLVLLVAAACINYKGVK